ncbi:MAG: ribonuclease J [Micavibrio aeruginosavorus]|uniref:Ribonuclease J n=1 Tax=Micavibrio aeruginosavorus TaxID=349221 RepID=A0A2W5MTH2_9BACT|nr:MAG: ribonuclease J [Micavibrio aeruginosavorus]
MNFKKDELYFIPLGGAEQFGVNLNVYGYQNKWLVIDCGLGFADEKFPGIDILLPDPKFVEDRKKEVVGMIITHAHEDHIGAVSHLWPRLRCPVYATPFTAAVLRKKMSENNACRDADIIEVELGEKISLKPFGVTFAPVTHSVPQTAALLIETEAGNIVHSGDWNLDPAPTIGSPTDPKPFQDFGKKGVLAYVGDSTNAEVDGVSGSEYDVEKGLAAVFKECRGRIAVTMFASNIGRLKSVCLAAKESGRQVALLGRSLHTMTSAARDCGYLKDVPQFVDEDDIGYLPDDKIIMVLTGSQGEARAQLARIARGEHQEVKFKQGDTVVFSARPIPGNEREIIEVKNNLAASRVKIISPRETPHCIHVSGHPARDEITQMLQWVKPQAVIAVHGERTMLEAHAALALDLQVPTAIVPNNGAVIRLYPGTPQVVDHVETGLLAVEPGRILKSDHQAIIQRRKLQFSGTVHATLVMNARGDLVADPQISTVGLVDPDAPDGEKFEDDIIEEIEDILADMTREELYDDKFVAEEMRIGLRRFVQHRLQIKPKTTIHLVRV